MAGGRLYVEYIAAFFTSPDNYFGSHPLLGSFVLPLVSFSLYYLAIVVSSSLLSSPLCGLFVPPAVLWLGGRGTAVSSVVSCFVSNSSRRQTQGVPRPSTSRQYLSTGQRYRLDDLIAYVRFPEGILRKRNRLRSVQCAFVYGYIYLAIGHLNGLTAAVISIYIWPLFLSSYSYLLQSHGETTRAFLLPPNDTKSVRTTEINIF